MSGDFYVYFVSEDAQHLIDRLDRKFNLKRLMIALYLPLNRSVQLIVFFIDLKKKITIKKCYFHTLVIINKLSFFPYNINREFS